MCTYVNTTRCGSTRTLKSGDSVTIDSKENRNGGRRESCAYLFKAPAVGHSLRLHVDELDISNCTQYLDIRNNAIGQQSPIR